MEEKLIELLKSNQAKYYKMAYRYVRNEEDAKDVVQEAILKAFKNLDKVNEAKYLDTWICKIVINTALTHVTKHKKDDLREDIEILKDESISSDSTNDMDLQNALNKLTQEEQLIIEYKYFRDLTFKEISNITGISENTIKTNVYKTLKKLKPLVE